MTNVKKNAVEQVTKEISSLYAAKKAYAEGVASIPIYSEDEIKLANSIVNIYEEVIGLLKLISTDDDDSETKNAKDVIISELSEHIEKYERLSSSGNSFYKTIHSLYLGLLATI